MSASLSLFRSSKPDFIESQISSKIIDIDFEASSFAGIGKSTKLGSELVSTMAKVGIFNLFASFSAMCSLIISTIKTAAG